MGVREVEAMEVGATLAETDPTKHQSLILAQPGEADKLSGLGRISSSYGAGAFLSGWKFYCGWSAAYAFACAWLLLCANGQAKYIIITKKWPDSE
mmetsp:Transcript_12784/g.19578  ORF Transcript_12784/g.19578 Transcript_12784/m.19578 type:complete len:95 (+) Transcript_12784:151-435(+)